MKNIIYWMDFYLLERFQSIADWTQEWFGINNLKLAKIFLYIYVILTFLLIFITFTHGGMKKVFQKELMNIYMVTSFYIANRTFIFYLESMRNSGMRLNHIIFMFNKKLSIVRVVIIMLLFLASIHVFFKDYEENYEKIYTFIELSSLIFLLSAWYLMLCNSDDDKKSKIKKFIEKTKGKINLLSGLKLRTQQK